MKLSGSCSGGRNRNLMLRVSLARGRAASSALRAARRPALSPSKLNTTLSVKRNSLCTLGRAGRAQRGHGVGKAQLGQGHHVHVAFGDQGVAVLAQAPRASNRP
jgi:hypothetical protein